MTISSSRKVTMQRVTLKLRQVCKLVFTRRPGADSNVDDVRDIYRRAAKEELVVEGLREGTNLVAEE